MIAIRISEDAIRDLKEGYFFYNAQQEGLGDYFLSCLKADIEGLKISGGTHRRVYRDYHRLLSRVFPYGIFYTLEEECAVVWAVADLRQNPMTLKKRLTS